MYTGCRYLNERRAILAAKQDALAKLYAAKAEESKKALSAGELMAGTTVATGLWWDS
jgi:hypothetical protein